MQFDIQQAREMLAALIQTEQGRAQMYGMVQANFNAFCYNATPRGEEPLKGLIFEAYSEAHEVPPVRMWFADDSSQIMSTDEFLALMLPIPGFEEQPADAKKNVANKIISYLEKGRTANGWNRVYFVRDSAFLNRTEENIYQPIGIEKIFDIVELVGEIIEMVKI